LTRLIVAMEWPKRSDPCTLCLTLPPLNSCLSFQRKSFACVAPCSHNCPEYDATDNQEEERLDACIKLLPVLEGSAIYGIHDTLRVQNPIKLHHTFRTLGGPLMDKGHRYMPKARRNQLLVQELADETLVFDETNQKAHCLNETAALVWRNCDGRTSVAKLARIVGAEIGGDVSEQVVWLALNQLKRSRLLETRFTTPQPVTRISRRELTRALGFAAVVALPLVTSMIVPSAVAAASTCGKDFDACSGSGQGTCCAGLVCCGGVICRPPNNCVD
jgi:hypothetical protein